LKTNRNRKLRVEQWRGRERDIFTYNDEIFSVIKLQGTEEEANKVETKIVL
jgi:hypothetical protein